MKKYDYPKYEITRLASEDVMSLSDIGISIGGDNGTSKGISWDDLKDDPSIN